MLSTPKYWMNQIQTGTTKQSFLLSPYTPQMGLFPNGRKMICNHHHLKMKMVLFGGMHTYGNCGCIHNLSGLGDL